MSFSTYDVVFAFVFRIVVGRTGESSKHVQQHVMVLLSYMLEMLPTLTQVGRTLIFVATWTECEELSKIAHMPKLPRFGLKLCTVKNTSPKSLAWGNVSGNIICSNIMSSFKDADRLEVSILLVSQDPPLD
jgi:hypothetical protein